MTNLFLITLTLKYKSDLLPAPPTSSPTCFQSVWGLGCVCSLLASTPSWAPGKELTNFWGWSAPPHPPACELLGQEGARLARAHIQGPPSPAVSLGIMGHI